MAKGVVLGPGLGGTKRAFEIKVRLANEPTDEKGLAMSIDRGVLAFAGLMVLLSLALGYYGSPYWYLLTAFVGLNLLQSSVTGFCPAAIVLRKLGVRPGAAFK
jgi:hypothetical protein